MKVKSTKAWHKLPCAHAQFFDLEPDGSPGECASWHGYDRSVIATFAGEIDNMGWIVPFGELKPVKQFLEYYFDHTALIPANDPRKDDIIKFNNTQTPLMFQIRVLPYGVSMEMSALFIWTQLNPYIYKITDGRCYVEKVECIEHDSNAAFVEFSEIVALKHAENTPEDQLLVMKPEWQWTSPNIAVAALNALKYYSYEQEDLQVAQYKR